MGCNCGKNAAPTGAMTGSREEAQRAVEAQAAALNARAANPSTHRIGPPEPVTQGGTQSFALHSADGRTQSFGSLLEARAERVRAGGGEITPS